MKKLFDAITGIDDKLVDEASNIPKNKKIIFYRLLPAAACLLIVLSTVLWPLSHESAPKFEGALMDVVFPKAFAFDDLDAWRKVRDENPLDDAFIDAVNSFSYKTSAKLLSNSEDNTTYSPVSMYYALAMAATGAENQTEAEFLRLLGVSDRDTLSQQCGNLYCWLYRNNEIKKLKISNSLWLNKAETFDEAFISNAADNFYAHSFNVDFSDESTPERMAEWVRRNTNGTLSPEINIDDRQMMSIFNTIYFSSQWVDEFNKDKTAEDIFYLPDGTDVNVDYLNSFYDAYSFVLGKNYTQSSLALKDGGAMFFILPDEGVTPRELLESADSVNDLVNGGERHSGEVTWQIPKFDFSSSIKASEALKELGLVEAFTEAADFSGITDSMVFLNKINQDTHISIDEKGVTASSFTNIDYAGATRPEDKAEMILNRPFIFGITQYNTLLFIGICDNPAK